MRNEPVPMPGKKITYKKAANGTVYVYYTLRAYRNKNGKPTSDEVAIGKLDSKTGNLIPNERYYEIFQDTKNFHTIVEPDAGGLSNTPKSIKNCGGVTVMTEIAKRIGLWEVLENCFQNTWRQLLACAFYILCEGNVMMYIMDWFDETKVEFAERMDDLDCSSLFASITREERARFFTEWSSRHCEQEYIAYDVSSISTYSGNIDIAEWGYNRDNDSLPQVNLGMFYGVTSSTPIYYDIYSGSIPDKSYMEFMMASAKNLGIQDVCFVMDCGFVTEDNLTDLRENQYSFITALPGQRLDALKLIDENKSDIRKSANRINEFEVYGIQRPIEMHGLNLQAYIYYDAEKQALDEKELYAHIDRLQAELGKMNRSKRVTKKYRDYFVIDEEPKNTLAFALDSGKVDAKLERAGFFILLSNKPDLHCAEILKIYRDRDVIEKHFDQFKNRLDFKRMRVHWNKTMEGKMFVGFLALILRSYLLRTLKGDTQTKRLTFEKVLIELRKIKTVTMSDETEMLIPLTKLQKTIFSALDIPIESLFI